VAGLALNLRLLLVTASIRDIYASRPWWQARAADRGSLGDPTGRRDPRWEVLASGLPIVVGFTVYQSFESDQVTETGIVPVPGHHEQVVGGHAVLVVGYDDSQSRFIVRNSWGDQWGLHGYFLMPYAYLTNRRLASDFWSANRTE
jgi:C1A family cysteine protease